MKHIPLEVFAAPVCAGARIVLLALYGELELRAAELEAYRTGGPGPLVTPSIAKLCGATGYKERNVRYHLAALADAGEIERGRQVVDGRIVTGWRLTPRVERRAA